MAVCVRHELRQHEHAPRVTLGEHDARFSSAGPGAAAACLPIVPRSLAKAMTEPVKVTAPTKHADEDLELRCAVPSAPRTAAARR